MAGRFSRTATIAVAVSLAAAMAAGLGGAVRYAQADTKDDLEKVEGKIGGAREDLDESSAALKQATEALRAAEVKLAARQSELAAVRGRLTAAQAKDRAMAAALEAAEAAVDRAERQLADAEHRVHDQRTEIGAFANASYRQQNVGDVAAILGSGTTREAFDRARAIASVTESQAHALDNLNSARADVAAREAALEVLEQQAEQRRKEAARNLRRVEELERQAEAAKDAVQEVVDERAAAEAAAQDAKAADAKRYEDLRAERERIKRILRELARKEREKKDDGGSDGGGGGGGSGGFAYPVDAPITSPYGMRFHPVLHVWKLHDGTDFGAGCGVPIRASASGTVVSTYYNSGYGNRVLIGHGYVSGASTVTAYNHLSSYAVSSGEYVSQGEVIGYVGTTGYSTGCHLHFMVYRNGSTTDPMEWL